MIKDKKFNKKWVEGLNGHFTKVDNIPKASTLMKRCWTLSVTSEMRLHRKIHHTDARMVTVTKTDNIFIRMWSSCNSYIGES